jgi:hypothetical protein
VYNSNFLQMHFDQQPEAVKTLYQSCSRSGSHSVGFVHVSAAFLSVETLVPGGPVLSGFDVILTCRLDPKTRSSMAKAAHQLATLHDRLPIRWKHLWLLELLCSWPQFRTLTWRTYITHEDKP